MTAQMRPFTPDSNAVARVVPSPNVGPRKNGLRPEILVLHYTGLPSIERSIEVLSDPRCEVSCHYVVAVDGETIQMVPEAVRAWHAGLSSWHGETDINSKSIGIEIQNPGHDMGYPDFPEAQMSAVEYLSRDIADRNGIQARNVVAHSDIAPGRKIDPGEKFDWRRLHRAGLCDWVEPEPLGTDRGLGRGDQGPVIASAQRRLAAYGYGIAPLGDFDEWTEKVVAAFQRRFRPARIDGRLDMSTLETLRRLTETTPR